MHASFAENFVIGIVKCLILNTYRKLIFDENNLRWENTKKKFVFI